jgi:redox-sensitive bicupin YhaK (pirin superfamily)
MDADPFLLFDHMGPMELAPGDERGFPDHPHRGFETVTYMLEGKMLHRDSSGNQGTIGPGDVQWMTAGSGLVHSEMPGAEIAAQGGRLQGFQIWVNLPARDKMVTPRYQEIPAARIPVGRNTAGTVQARVIAGEALGAQALIDTRVPISYLHFTLAPAAEHTQPVLPDQIVLAYVITGQGAFGADRAAAADRTMVLFDKGGDAVTFANTGHRPLDLLLLAGTPLGEPVARHGPFVMNTQEELVQAFEDFRSGKMGRL